MSGRKIAFSTKQKKEQLKAKRQRKKNQEYNEDGMVEHRQIKKTAKIVQNVASDSDSSSQSGSGIRINVKKLNEQPGGKNFKGYDPNRYKLHVLSDTDASVKEGTRVSRLPMDSLTEEALEIDLDDSYKLGTVLDMPKRPNWDYQMSQQQLDAVEHKYFTEYVEKMFEVYHKQEINLELNLETWRQLWRVIDMSDVILLIADIRHPALHFSPSLYHYIVDELKKHLVLVLNKIDYAPPALVVAWREYFQSKFPELRIICFTSYPKDEMERKQMMTDPGQMLHQKRRKRTFTAVGPKQLLQVCDEISGEKVDLSSWREKIEGDICTGGGYDDEDDAPVSQIHIESTDVVHKQYQMFSDGVLTIGCCGYPNVGKSSLINGLVGKKVVSVSRTPGHTKHFQTIFLTQTVKLCDSPGLVFPSLVARPLQILSGIFPIAQVREPYTSVKYLAERIPIVTLLKLKHPELDPSDKSSGVEPKWSAYHICDAWAEKRGFRTAKAGRNDTYRAANHILRMATQGKLCLCMRPPQYSKQEGMWLVHKDTEEINRLQAMHREALHFTDSESDEGTSDNADNEEEEDENTSQGIAELNPFAALSDD